VVWAKLSGVWGHYSAERFIYRTFRGVPPRLTSHDWSTKYVLYSEKNYNWGEGKALSEILSTTSTRGTS